MRVSPLAQNALSLLPPAPPWGTPSHHPLIRSQVPVADLKCHSPSPAFGTLLFPTFKRPEPCCWWLLATAQGTALHGRDVFQGALQQCPGAAWHCLSALLPLKVLPDPPQESGPQTWWDVAFVTSCVCRDLETPANRPGWNELPEMSCPRTWDCRASTGSWGLTQPLHYKLPVWLRLPFASTARAQPLKNLQLTLSVSAQDTNPTNPSNPGLKLHYLSPKMSSF